MALNMRLMLVLALGTWCSDVAHGFAFGGGEGACDNLTPGHGWGVQALASPYSLDVMETYYMTNREVTVTLSGDTLRGFMIQARKEGSGERVGTFVVDSNGQSRCDGAAITHVNNADKNSVTVKWMTSSSDGPIRFRAAVVQTFAIYWNDVYSAVITDQTGNAAYTTSTTTTAPGAETSTTTTPYPAMNYTTTMSYPAGQNYTTTSTYKPQNYTTTHRYTTTSEVDDQRPYPDYGNGSPPVLTYSAALAAVCVMVSALL